MEGRSKRPQKSGRAKVKPAKKGVGKTSNREVRNKTTESAAPKKTVRSASPKSTRVKNIGSKPARVKAVKRTQLKRKKLESQDLDHNYLGRKDRWLIIQLSEDCDLREDAELVVQELKELCGDSVEYFLPLYTEYVQDKPVCLVLFEGYVFVKEEAGVDNTCFKERVSKIEGPLLSNGLCQYLKNKDINKFKRDLKQRLKSKVPKKGQTVVPVVGDYKNLEGIVLSIDRKRMIAKIEFALSSRVVVVQIRIINLEVLE
jgi:transcription antitermination factor NusG